MRTLTTWFFVVAMAMLVSCNHTAIFEQYQNISQEAWDMQDSICFHVAMNDTTSRYNVLLHIRNTEQYPYQNLWLFVDEYQGETCVYQDTIEALLADVYGRWLGTGISRYELPLLYDEQRRFERTGEHRFVIRQGMRSEWLKGIQDVGLVIRE
jgi:gliding motility-associated lipoprotein GldH